MADPLSVAASVVGLLAAGAKITKVLGVVISKARGAPENCRKIRTQVDDIIGVLSQLQLFVVGTSRASRSRTSLILVDQVIITLAACVTTFSELDSFARSLQSDADMGVLDRFRWMSKEQEIKDVLQRLESHKASLLLMMTILTWYVGIGPPRFACTPRLTYITAKSRTTLKTRSTGCVIWCSKP